MLKQTPSQTLGPFFSIGMTYGNLNRLIDDETPGEPIIVRGRVVDGDDAPIEDAAIEIWQADSSGSYGGDFVGFGRAATDNDGQFTFHTIKPGSLDGMAPHINVRILMRGLLLPTLTRLYFADEDNTADPVLNGVPADRRATLIADRLDRSGTATYRFDIRMQGDRETVFFEP